jgi:hypothetical protein
MSLVKVWTDVGTRKPVALLAKIVEKDGVIFTIRYLTSGPDSIWRYEDDTYEIDDDSIAEYLGTDDETKAGFKAVDGGFIQDTDLSDEDYEPSDEDHDEETESDISGEEEFDEEDAEPDEEFQESDEDEEEYIDE